MLLDKGARLLEVELEQRVVAEVVGLERGVPNLARGVRADGVVARLRRQVEHRRHAERLQQREVGRVRRRAEQQVGRDPRRRLVLCGPLRLAEELVDKGKASFK